MVEIWDRFRPLVFRNWRDFVVVKNQVSHFLLISKDPIIDDLDIKYTPSFFKYLSIGLFILILINIILFSNVVISIFIITNAIIFFIIFLFISIVMIGISEIGYKKGHDEMIGKSISLTSLFISIELLILFYINRYINSQYYYIISIFLFLILLMITYKSYLRRIKTITELTLSEKTMVNNSNNTKK